MMVGFEMTAQNLQIRLLSAEDIQSIADAFQTLGWNKPAAQYTRYLLEQQRGQRTVLVAFINSTFAGYLTVNWQSDYPPFRDGNIPEIQDFNVLPPFRRQGIGTQLMETAERMIAQRAAIAGIGVGMYADYGAAQRLYVLRGYIPDGRGLFINGEWIKAGMQIIVNDDLVLYFTKQLHQE
jgi:GNAT superfamily N-acetyltransferase